VAFALAEHHDRRVPFDEECGMEVNSKGLMAHEGDGEAVAGAGDISHAFETAVGGLRATGASSDMRELVELIVRHGAEEGALLATYESLAAESTDASVRYLVNLILEDEHRHHRLLAQLSNAMAWGTAERPPVETVPGLPSAISGPLLEQTRRLRKAEQADYRALADLKKRLRPFADTTLWVLVIDLMLLDTKKHATILEFLERCKDAG
jgi:hypothetical protein